MAMALKDNKCQQRIWSRARHGTYKVRGLESGVLSNDDDGRTRPASSTIRLANPALSGSDTGHICSVHPHWQRLAGGQGLDFPPRHIHCLLCPPPALAPYPADLASSIHPRDSSGVFC